MKVFNYSGSQHPTDVLINFLKWRAREELNNDDVIELAYMDTDESNEQKLTVITAQGILTNDVIILYTPILVVDTSDLF